MQKQSLIKELLERRIPQIIGLYIAATWMMIEIGDWITERFNTPESVTSYIFIGMLVCLPSVIFLAYQYGKPGKDPWKKTTFVFVPSNLVAACFAMFYLVSPVEATETRTIVDEKGVAKSYEVPKQEFHNQVITFFWKNNSDKTELDWMRYGLAWLLSKDLDRSLFVSARTPFNYGRFIADLRKAGYQNALDIPRSLQLEMARKRFLKYTLEGQFDFQNGLYKLVIDIYSVKTGKLHASHSASGKDLLPLIDDLTINIKNSLAVPTDLNDQSTDLPIKEHTSDSLPAIKDLVESKIKRQLENNYPASKQLLEEAIKKDFSFAHAYTELTQTNQLMGKGNEASQALTQAFKHEYKLTTEEKFLYRGFAYGLKGDYVSQVKIYDMWVDLFPNDIQAYQVMARVLLVTGIDHDKTLFCLKKLRELTPDDDSVLRNLTQLFVLRDELPLAIETQKQYVELNPQDNDGLIELASIYERTAQFELAKETYRRVLLLEMDNYSAAIKLALLDLKLGNFESAENQLATLLANSSSNKSTFDVLKGYVTYHVARGQFEQVLKVIEKMKLNSEHLPPLLQIFELDFSHSLYLAHLGRFDQSLEALAAVKAKLQPPLDGIIELGAVSAHLLAKDTEKAAESIRRIEVFIKSYPNPMFSSALDSSKGQLKDLQKDYAAAVELHQSALNMISGTVVNTQNETSILGQKTLLANARLENGNIEQAKQELLAVLAIYPSLPIAHLVLAQCYLAEKDMPSFRASMENVEKSWKNADKDYIEFKNFMELKLANP